MATDRDRATALAAQWLSWDPNAVTCDEIASLVSAENWAHLNKLLGSRLRFGTAGLRARMGAGNVCMNVLTVLQTTQGLVAYLKQHFSAQQLAEQGIGAWAAIAPYPHAHGVTFPAVSSACKSVLALTRFTLQSFHRVFFIVFCIQCSATTAATIRCALPRWRRSCF